ncbi:hypothetical protein CRENBAI_009205 [Crenichthys baileyi]|uniref:Uncharacterized protein n=1 Tax=Crenichthys baileyi TaxID=28760 RepID=A0AAV9SMX2_9TELE
MDRPGEPRMPHTLNAKAQAGPNRQKMIYPVFIPPCSSAFAARSRSTDWPDRNEPPHAPVSRSHVSRCPPNGIAIWDTKCMRGTRPMHPDGSRKGKIGSAFTPPPFGGPRSHGRNGGLVLLGARPRTTYPSLSLLEGVLRTTSS